MTQYEARNSLPLGHCFSVNNSRSQFLKAKLTNGKVAILSHQASSMLNTFSTANALVYVGEGDYELKENELVTVYWLKN
jgi:molybdopterin molybdotransferase